MWGSCNIVLAVVNKAIELALSFGYFLLCVIVEELARKNDNFIVNQSTSNEHEETD